MLISLTFLTPLLVCFSLMAMSFLPGDRSAKARKILAIGAPLAVLPAVMLALLVPPAQSQSEAEGAAQFSVPWLLFGADFAIDVTARALLLVTALLYGSALMALSWLKLKNTESNYGVLAGFLLACFVGNIGVYLAADVVTFYACFALMSFAAAGLVVHYRTAQSYRATGIYLVLSVISETALLAGCLLATHSAQSTEIAEVSSGIASSDSSGLILGLLLVGFGIKAGSVPLHVWLPLAHPAAPPAASAVLSGAMVKAGLIGWLRFLPLGDDSAAAAVETAGWVLLVFALVGAFAAVVVGVFQDDPKAVLAYSTISQMGFIAAVVAVGLIKPEVAAETSLAAVLYAVHHSLAKGALFLGVPVVKHYAAGGFAWLVWLGLGGAAFAVAGAPLTSGALGKYASKEAVGELALVGIAVADILPWVATGSALLLIRFFFLMTASTPASARAVDGELVSWLLLCAAGIVVPWFIGSFWLTDQEGPLSLPSWDFETVWDSSWPIALGLVLGWAVWFLARRRVLPESLIHPSMRLAQPGDVITVEEPAVLSASRGLMAVLDSVLSGLGRAGQWAGGLFVRGGQRAQQVSESADSVLSRWGNSGVALLALLTGLMVMVVILW